MFSKKIYSSIIACSLAIVFSANVYAGGVTLGATRVIYPSESKQISLPLKNTDENASFLLQAWAENEAGAKTDDIIITPPVFVIKPKKENVLRIMYAGKPLPTDRESVFWVNVKAIPSMSKETRDGNSLQLAVVSRIKMFYRPSTLKENPDEVYNALRFSRQGNAITIYNPTPFYITAVNLHAGINKLENVMIAPKSQNVVQAPRDGAGEITYQTINDYGATTKKEIGVSK